MDLQLERVWDWPNGIEAAYRTLFGSVPEGVSWPALPFSAPGEVELFDSEAEIRIGEYGFSRSGRASKLIKELGLVLIGVRQWRDPVGRPT
jgi:hypothetical protein